MKTKTTILSFLLLLCALTIKSQTGTSGQNVNLETDTIFRPYLIGIVVSNVEKSAEWYKENFGFGVVQKMDFPAYDSLHIIHMRLGKVELELIQKKSSFSIRKYVPDYDGFDKAPLIGFSKIAFWITDAEALANKLKRNGVKFLVNMYDDQKFGVRSFIVEDLDSNVLQFNQPLLEKNKK